MVLYFQLGCLAPIRRVIISPVLCCTDARSCFPLHLLLFRPSLPAFFVGALLPFSALLIS